MKKELAIAFFVMASVWLRLIPHLPNFTPITSLALFSGVFFKRKELSLLVPLIAMGLSDIVLGFYQISFWVYGGFILVTMLGWLMKEIKVTSVLVSSIIFFIVSNLGVWFIGYQHTFNNLIECYVLGIPFFGYSIAGDLVWSFILFNAWSLIEDSKFVLKKV